MSILRGLKVILYKKISSQGLPGANSTAVQARAQQLSGAWDQLHLARLLAIFPAMPHTSTEKKRMLSEKCVIFTSARASPREITWSSPWAYPAPPGGLRVTGDTQAATQRRLEPAPDLLVCRWWGRFQTDPELENSCSRVKKPLQGRSKAVDGLQTTASSFPERRQPR